MEIIYTKISDLKPAKYNPRKISEKQLQDIQNSLKEFGFVDPVIANKDFTIIGGHQRIKAWSALGYDTVPVFFMDLDKRKEKELNVRLNKNTGEFDFKILLDEFTTDDLLNYGFEAFELDLQLDDLDGQLELPDDVVTAENKEENKNEKFVVCPECGFKIL